MGKIKKIFRYDNVGILFVLPAFVCNGYRRDQLYSEKPSPDQ